VTSLRRTLQFTDMPGSSISPIKEMCDVLGPAPVDETSASPTSLGS
jgi:hypothetical protein